MKVAELDEEHRRCTVALRALETERSPKSLLAVLEVFTQHFAHEEAMLDEHLYGDIVQGKQVGGFSVDANMRTSHWGDHARMLKEIERQLAQSGKCGKVPPAFVDKVLRDFENHADKYDGAYADRLEEILMVCEPCA